MLGAGKDRGRRWGYKGPEAAKLEASAIGWETESRRSSPVGAKTTEGGFV